jgi:hypothetical protein
MILRGRSEETHVRYDRTCTLWIYNDILNKVMTISDNWIARNMQIRLVKRSSAHNHHFHWMVYVVLWHVVRFSQISHALVASIQSQDAIGAIGISFCYIFNHVCLTCSQNQYFYFERTWWRLFQKCVVHTKCDIYVFINKLYSQIICYVDNYILFNFPMAPLRDVSI